MGEELRWQRPRMDAVRAQMRSAPASMHVNYQEIHSMQHSNENIRTSRNIIGISKNSALRPKLEALRTIRDASSRPYEWQELPMQKPSELPKADALRGRANGRGVLYSLPCNSQTINQNPRSAPRIPSKLDVLRHQMASAPASIARSSHGNLHSCCYDYLYKKDGSHRRPKLDEKALKMIDRRLDAADSFGQSAATNRSARSYPDSPCTCNHEIRSRTHRRRSKADAMRSTLGSAPSGSLHSRDNTIVDEFHSKNYRLRSDLDALRRKQRSAEKSMDGSRCGCQDAEKIHKPAKKAVNFKELKDDLYSRYNTQETPSQSYRRPPSRPASRRSDGLGTPSSCTRNCEASSCNCDEINSYNLRKKTGDVGYGSQPEKAFREDPSGYAEDLQALSDELEASQVRCERLDKSLQRQKMMLRLIRRNKERKNSLADMMLQPANPAPANAPRMHHVPHDQVEWNAGKWNPTRK